MGSASKRPAFARSQDRIVFGCSVGLGSDIARAPGPPCGAWWTTADGVRLPGWKRNAGVRRRLRHVAVHCAEALGLVALAAFALLAFRLSSGPIYFDWLHDRVASSLQDRIGGGYSVQLGPTYVMHDSWGLGSDSAI